MKINKKEYRELPLSFNVVCRLEDMGIELSDIEGKSLSTMRAWLAICMDTDVETAGAELEKHVMNGGKFEDIAEAFGMAVETSGFFQALQTQTEETPQEAPKAKAKKKE